MLKYLAFALPLALAGTAQAASFDCAKAAAPDEKAICAHLELNDADVRMATILDIELQLVAMGQRDAIRDAQKAWLTLRGKCGGDVACISAAYQRRLTDLDKVFKDIASRGPF
jgi:uncharacterized protein